MATDRFHHDRLQNVEMRDATVRVYCITAISTLRMRILQDPMESFITHSLHKYENAMRQEIVFILRAERPRALNHLGACPWSSCGRVIFRRGRISYRPRRAVGRDARRGRELYFRKSMWHTGAQFIAERSPRSHESRESSGMRLQLIPDLRRSERTNLIMRLYLLLLPPHLSPLSVCLCLCLSSSLFLSVWDSVSRESCKVARMPSTE